MAGESDEVTEEEVQRLVAQITPIAAKYGFTKVEIPGTRSVGVQGDARVYLPVALIGGRIPPDTQAGIDAATEICNLVSGVGRVCMDIL